MSSANQTSQFERPSVRHRRFLSAVRNQKVRPKMIDDRRRHQRLWISLLGRFMRADKHEYPCQLINISPGGAALRTPSIAEMGERIVVYIDRIGRIEGQVVRFIEGGFAIKLSATPHKRDRLADQLTWLANHEKLALPDERRFERFPPRVQLATLRTEDGRSFQVRVLDISLGGALVDSKVRLPVGSIVHVGRLQARVVRHTQVGIGVAFVDKQSEDSLSRQFG